MFSIDESQDDVLWSMTEASRLAMTCLTPLWAPICTPCCWLLNTGTLDCPGVLARDELSDPVVFITFTSFWPACPKLIRPPFEVGLPRCVVILCSLLDDRFKIEPFLAVLTLGEANMDVLLEKTGLLTWVADWLLLWFTLRERFVLLWVAAVAWVVATANGSCCCMVVDEVFCYKWDDWWRIFGC